MTAIPKELDPATIPDGCKPVITVRGLRNAFGDQVVHEGLDLDTAESFWSTTTGIPRTQFGAPYRAHADVTRRANKHLHGCAYVRYSCVRTHREVMGVVRALLASYAGPG